MKNFGFLDQHTQKFFCFYIRCATKHIQLNLSKPKLLGINFCVQFIPVKLTKISRIRTLFKVRFKQDFGLFRVRFRQVSLQHLQSYISKTLIESVYSIGLVIFTIHSDQLSEKCLLFNKLQLFYAC